MDFWGYKVMKIITWKLQNICEAMDCTHMSPVSQTICVYVDKIGLYSPK